MNSIEVFDLVVALVQASSRAPSVSGKTANVRFRKRREHRKVFPRGSLGHEFHDRDQHLVLHGRTLAVTRLRYRLRAGRRSPSFGSTGGRPRCPCAVEAGAGPSIVAANHDMTRGFYEA